MRREDGDEEKEYRKSMPLLSFVGVKKMKYFNSMAGREGWKGVRMSGLVSGGDKAWEKLIKKCIIRDEGYVYPHIY